MTSYLIAKRNFSGESSVMAGVWMLIVHFLSCYKTWSVIIPRTMLYWLMSKISTVYIAIYCWKLNLILQHCFSLVDILFYCADTRAFTVHIHHIWVDKWPEFWSFSFAVHVSLNDCSSFN